jgi:hypothetical protein
LLSQLRPIWSLQVSKVRRIIWLKLKVAIHSCLEIIGNEILVEKRSNTLFSNSYNLSNPKLGLNLTEPSKKKNIPLIRFSKSDLKSSSKFQDYDVSLTPPKLLIKQLNFDKISKKKMDS